MKCVISKHGHELPFPVVNIGQLDKATVAMMERQVKSGKLVKYEDYTYPITRMGYAVATTGNKETQILLETLRSLLNGSWVNVPETAMKIQRDILAKLDSIKNCTN